MVQAGILVVLRFLRVLQFEYVPLTFTRWRRSYRYTFISSIPASLNPYAFSLASIRLWQTESKALLRSTVTAATCFLSSRFPRQSSVILSSAVQHEWPLRNPDRLRDKCRWIALYMYIWSNITFS